MGKKQFLSRDKLVKFTNWVITGCAVGVMVMGRVIFEQ